MPGLFGALIDADTLEQHLRDPRVRVVDLTTPGTYDAGHIPGAVHIEYTEALRQQPPAMGLVPDEATLSRLMSRLGIAADTVVVAYDNEGSGRAARLLWTLEVAGHPADQLSLLDGGYSAWFAGDREADDETTAIKPTEARCELNPTPIASREYILAHWNDDNVLIIDARTPEEYHGKDVRAARGGHIPGAVNLNWMDLWNRDQHNRLIPNARARFEAIGATPEKEIILYCQTHHRSAYLYMILRHFGYTRIKGYPGSWSDWGNHPETPIEA